MVLRGLQETNLFWLRLGTCPPIIIRCPKLIVVVGFTVLTAASEFGTFEQRDHRLV